MLLEGDIIHRNLRIRLKAQREIRIKMYETKDHSSGERKAKRNRKNNSQTRIIAAVVERENEKTVELQVTTERQSGCVCV